VTPILAFILRAALQTVRNPREGARQVMAFQMDRRARWEALLLIAVLSAILAYLSMLAGMIVNSEPSQYPVSLNPIMLGISQLVVMLVMVFAIHLIGNWAGGQGELDDAILLVAWMQFILVCLQVLQILAVVFFPVLALLLGLAGLVLIFVLLTYFVSELHGFKSMPGVFFSVLFVMLILATFIRFIFSLFGFDVIGVI
jgi:hypothetical protein